MKAKQKQERIVILSDSTGETAEHYVRAVLAQFGKADAELLRLPRIREERELLRALDKIEAPYLVAYTFAKEKLRKLVWAECRKRNLLGVDILYPAIEVFSEFLHRNPSQEHGVLHSTQAINYFERIEAIEFAVKHDDGMKMNELDQADIVLTGVSRTSKTPTSMYLAHKGYKVGNVPLVYGTPPPEPLTKASENGIPIFFFAIDATQLVRIRKSRVDRLGSAPSQSDIYVNIQRITEELDAAFKMARRYKWTIIDVTNKAVEETASEILLLVSSKGS